MTNKTKFFSAAFALASLISTAASAAEPQQRFVHDGTTYVYTATQKGDATVINGRRLSDGSSFRYVVRNGRVRGSTGGQPVAFAVSEAQGASQMAPVAVAD